MAKLPFTKLQLKQNQEVKTIEFNGQVIEVKRYLPIQTKLALISNVLNNSLDENINKDFYNPVQIEVFLGFEIIEKYTNIEFSEEDKNDIPVLYDLLKGNGVLDLVFETVGASEIMELRKQTKACIKAIYEYEHSIMGVLEKFNTGYEQLDLDVSNIQAKLANSDNINFLKDIMSKLG